MSDSQSSQSADTNQEDLRVGAEGEAIAIGANSELDLQVIDGGAFKFGEGALKFAEGISQSLASLAQDTGDRADDALARAFDIAETRVEDAQDKVGGLVGTLVVAGAAVLLFTELNK